MSRIRALYVSIEALDRRLGGIEELGGRAAARAAEAREHLEDVTCALDVALGEAGHAFPVPDPVRALADGLDALERALS